MTVVNPKSISGINSITMASGSDNLLTIHTNNGTERLRIDSTGTTKIVTGIVTTLTATTGIVTTLTANTVTSLGAVSGTTGTFTGNVAVSGANITLQDSGGASDDRLVLGAGSDLSIYHDGSNSYVANTTGTLLLQSTATATVKGTTVQFENAAGTEVLLKAIQDGAVELYHDNIKRFQTYNEGIQVLGTEGGNASIQFKGDEGDDNNDNYRLIAGDGTSFYLQNYASGSWETNILATGNGAVELYHDNVKVIETNTTGIQVGFDGAVSNPTIKLPDDGFLTWGTSDSAFIQGADAGSGGYIKFNANNGLRARIDGDGLKFGSDTAAVNALDDYEEGNFTPTSNGTLSHGTGFYTKIGRQVTIHLRVIFASSSSGTVAQILSLPFVPSQPSSSSNGAVPCGFGYISSSSNLTGAPQVHLTHNESKLTFYNFSSILSLGALSGKEFRFGVVYQAAT